MKINVSNPDLSSEKRTFLSQDWSSGTNLVVANNDGFTVNWFVVVGEPGQEQTEAQTVSTTSTNTIVTISSALKFAHGKSSPVYRSQWDKVSFEQKVSGGSFTAISASPLAIAWDDADNNTLIDVSNGASTDTYRWRFYNSNTAVYSDYSDELGGTGFSRKTVGYILEQVKRNSVARNIEDAAILDYANDYQTDVVYPEIPKAWWFTKEGTAAATVASTYTYSIDANWSDFLAQKFLRYRYVNGDTDITYSLTWSPPAEFYNLKSDANQPTDDYAKYWTILPPDSSSDKGYIGLHPTPKTTACQLKPVYFFELTDLDSFGDSLLVPHAKGYIDYVLYRIHDDIKSDNSNADKFNARVARSIIYLKRLARRQLGQPELFRFRGQRGWSRLFGEQTRLNSSEARELYW